LHPEKYLAEPREEPLRIEWPDTTAQGAKPLADNVLGEAGMRILLAQWIDGRRAEKAAAGWRGDRYLVFDDGRAVVWRSVWAGPEEAAAFSSALADAWARRYGVQFVQGDGVATVSGPREIKLLTINANEVVLIDCEEKQWAADLAEKFASPAYREPSPPNP
jgi:hypothetical protein